MLFAGYKMTIEPPRGVKANLLKAFMNQVPDFADYLNSGDPKVPNFKVRIRTELSQRDGGVYFLHPK